MFLSSKLRNSAGRVHLETSNDGATPETARNRRKGRRARRPSPRVSGTTPEPDRATPDSLVSDAFIHVVVRPSSMTTCSVPSSDAISRRGHEGAVRLPDSRARALTLLDHPSAPLVAAVAVIVLAML